MKQAITDFSITELKDILSGFNEKPFHAAQIFKSLHAGLRFFEMTDISKSFREKLSEQFNDTPIRIIKNVKSVDGTEKFLFELADGNLIEGVLMRYKYGATLCVSTQVGCRMGCAFCASGLEGLLRNLTAGEILGEVIAVNKYIGGGTGENRKVINIVLMGSGEPLDNYDNVVKFLRLVSADGGLNVSARNISLSTSGLVPNMIRLADEGLPVNLTVSLHSPFDEERKTIMPVAKRYSISEILSACDNYFNKTGRRYIFEYVLILGKNDDTEHAEGLIKILKGRPCHINLIRLNEIKEREMKTVTDRAAYRFMGMLEKAGLSATVRRRMGSDIDGACGQLRRRYMEKENSSDNKG